MRRILLILIGVMGGCLVQAQQDSSAVAAQLNKAVEYWISGRFAEAHPILDAAASDALAAGRFNQYIQVRHQKMMTYIRETQYDRALALGKDILKASRRLQGTPHLRQARILGSLSESCSRSGNPAEAVEWSRQAIQVAEAVGEQETAYDLLLGLGVAQMKSGDYEGAKTSYQRYEQHYFKHDNPKKLSKAYNNLAVLNARIGDIEEAAEYMVQVLHIQEKAAKPNWMAITRSYYNLATIYIMLRRPHQALKYIEAGDVVIKKHLNSSITLLADNQLVRSNIYDLLQEPQKSLKAIKTMVALREKIHEASGDDYILVRTYLHLAEAYLYAQNGPAAQAALDKAQPYLTEDLTDQSFYHNKCMHTAYMLGDWDKMEYHLKKGIQINKQVHGEQTYNVSVLYLNVANWALEDQQPMETVLGYLDSCEAYLVLAPAQSVQEAVEKGYYQRGDRLRQMLTQRTQVYLEAYAKTPNTAYLKEAEAALALAEQLAVRELRQGLERDDKQYQLETLQGMYAQAVTLHYLQHQEGHNTLDLEETLRAMENNKSVLLTEALHHRKAQKESTIPDSLQAQQAEYQARLATLKEQQLHASVQERNKLGAALIQAEYQLDTLQQHLAARYPAYARQRYQNSALSLAQVRQKVLDERTALLEFFVTKQTTFQLVITKDQAYLYDLKLPQDSLAVSIKTFRQLLTTLPDQTDPSEATQQFKQQSHALYQHLLASALKPLQGIEQLIIIPDFTLGHLPFEVLLVQPAESADDYQDLDYLLHHYTLRYSYSTQLLTQQIVKQSETDRMSLLAVAGDYGPIQEEGLLMRSRTQQRLRKTLTPLPAAQEEVDLLSRLYPSGTFWTGTEGNEAAFKAIAGDYDVLHLAVHGILNTQEPMLSCLAFTEDRDSLDDNFWYAYEISEQPLRAKLVVLSACETGYGKFEQGEGVQSLARSFMYAGVPSTVVSLWQVNDYATSKIMGLFYQQLKAGQPTAQALTLAKRQYLNEMPDVICHPGFWAAFVAIGQDVVVVEASTPWWQWLAGALVLAAVGSWGYRRWRSMG